MYRMLVDWLSTIVKWTNSNQGFLAVLIFIFTLSFGWVTGIFGALRRKPKLKFEILEGPTFCCTFETGREHKEFRTHRTCFSLYLKIRNIGAADTTIEEIHIGYSSRMIGRRFRRIWLTNQTTALADFRVNIGDIVKVYPFLLQRNNLIPYPTGDAFISIGSIRTGVCYWEQEESYGGFFPQTDRNNCVKIKVRMIDAYHRRYARSFSIPMFSLEEARRFFPEFGMTGETLIAAATASS